MKNKIYFPEDKTKQEMIKCLIEFCDVNCIECNILCGTHCALYDSKNIIEKATGLKIEEVLSE